MKRAYIILILSFAICRGSIAQIKYEGSAKIYEKADKQPEFPGGEEAFKEFTKSPVDNRLRDYYCDVQLSCVIEKDGTLDKIKLLPSYPDEDCVKQAIKRLKLSPKWNPGLIAGKPVRVRIILTVTLNYTAPSFTLNRLPGRNFIYTNVEEMPHFIGGIEAFYSYIKANMTYPATALKNETQGKVYVSFVVERNGKLTQLKVYRGIGDGCDEEALRLIKKTSKQWTPGKKKGLPVRTAFSMPVDFSL